MAVFCRVRQVTAVQGDNTCQDKGGFAIASLYMEELPQYINCLPCCKTLLKKPLLSLAAL